MFITVYSRLLIGRCQREIKINIDLSIHPLIHHPPKEEKIRGITMSVNYIMINGGKKLAKQSLKCIDSFVCVCREKDISAIEEKRGCNKIGD